MFGKKSLHFVPRLGVKLGVSDDSFTYNIIFSLRCFSYRIFDIVNK